MTTLGMPNSMALVFAATILAGSLGAIHFVVVHMIMGRPFADEAEALEVRSAGERTADPSRRKGGADHD